MKTFLLLLSLGFAAALAAQNGDELLVYSLKGNASVIENGKETKLKIGKVLKPGDVLKTQPGAKLTMVCKEGKPLSVVKPGVYPINKWKDSCRMGHNSVSSKYFQYIWDQMYVRSDEYKKEHGEATAAVVRGNNPNADETMEIYFDPAMDTIYYSSGKFPLSWATNNKTASACYFKLVNLTNSKTVYQDSITGNSLSLDKIRKYMKAGNNYSWTIAVKKTVVNGGIIKYLAPATVNKKIQQLQKMEAVPEDSAALYFRTAFLLETEHYMADAFSFYEKAAAAAPDVTVYKDKLDDFKVQFQMVKN